jgi:hypothetical protein
VICRAFAGARRSPVPWAGGPLLRSLHCGGPFGAGGDGQGPLGLGSVCRKPLAKEKQDSRPLGSPYSDGLPCEATTALTSVLVHNLDRPTSFSICFLLVLLGK